MRVGAAETTSTTPDAARPAPEAVRQTAVAWRPALFGLMAGVIGTLLIGSVVMGPWVLAKRGDLPLERVYGDFAVSIASRIGGGNAQNPVAQNPRASAAGRDAYTGSCSVCHGATGDGRGAFGTSSYPNATDLRSHDAAEKSDAQLFWIIKNGLNFTGMPGYADQYTDQDIWSLVTYVRALQDPNRASPSGPGGRPQPAASNRPGGGAFQLAVIDVPTPTADQLDRADPFSSQAVARGAAVYFAQGYQTCHAAAGDAPGNLGLRRGGSAEDVRAVRQVGPGCPPTVQAS